MRFERALQFAFGDGEVEIPDKQLIVNVSDHSFATTTGFGERSRHRSLPIRPLLEALPWASYRRTPSTCQVCSETQLLGGALQHAIAKGNPEYPGKAAPEGT
jgi:hypothetical protein